MKTSALIFLLVLLLSHCYCDDSILKMIETQPEGREIMNALFLQVHSKGANLQTGDVLRVLKFARDKYERTESQIKNRNASKQKECSADLTNFALRLQQNQKWEFTITRHVESNNRSGSRLRNFIERSTQEQTDYTGLKNIIEASWTNWKNFQNTALVNLGKVRQSLHKAIETLRSLDKETSFVQMNENSQYFTNLNEIRVDFEGNFVNLEGFRPVIVKLLELMSNAKAIDKPLVRKKLRRVLDKIRVQIGHRSDEIKAINERQNSIFGAILESYKENLLRIRKLLERLNKENNHLNIRGAALKTSQLTSRAISKESRNIFTSRKRQCRNYADRVAQISVAMIRTRNIVAQIGEILSERFGALRSYFIQRDMSLLQLK